MTIHNTPDDLVGPPSLNAASRMQGRVDTRGEGSEEREEGMVI